MYARPGIACPVSARSDADMTRAWLAVAAAAVVIATAAAWLVLRRRPRGERLVQIVDLDDATAFDSETGAVRSVQRADLLIDDDALARDLDARPPRAPGAHLLALPDARHARADPRPLHRGRALGRAARAARCGCSPSRRPNTRWTRARGLVRWRIARGLLVSRRGRDGRGYLQIEVRRGGTATGAGPRALHVEVEVANFYPSIASRLSRRLYNATQSRIHVIVTYGFLRSLARLDLAESRVGRFDVAG